MGWARIVVESMGKPMVYSLVGHCNVVGPDSDWNGKLLEGVA